ncbi:hypothetical protein I5M32_10460 [Pedobacter sp. SD-b]|uniref:ABC-2 type transport system permease protein n=1 Tax=Pedobacter segetis TaxID=2793069 RepID=A0ABS1BKH1_9SPHI|nr:hypothetical protein [Pedobacter segetis]MBK0383383.1 hypothetical protein [Pedobacter segetis]
MFNKYIINFVLLLKPIFQKFGVDPEQLRIILITKMKMDDRRPNVYNQRQKKKKEVNNASWIVMFFLGLTGLFFTFLLASLKQPFLAHTVYFSAFMVMLAITLISDFTNVLIDVRDNYIILPRPVNDRTFTVSRILHIGIHTAKMAFAISISGVIYSFIGEGVLSGSMFIIEVLIATTLSIFLVNITYLIVLKITSPQKFKDFISYFQIILSIVIFAAYYTLPRLIESSLIKKIDISNVKVLAIVPSYWLAALHELVVNIKIAQLSTYIYAALAILSPIVSLYLVVKVLAPGFNQKLSSISASGDDGVVVSSEGKGASKGFMNIIAQKIAPHPLENAGFKITWLLSSRYRDFKVKVYPSFAYVPVYFVYFGFINKKGGSLSDNWHHLLEGRMYILLMYLTGFVLTTVLQHISMTEKYKASWVFFTTPHNQPGRILGGMFKAVVIKYYLPYFIAIGIFSITFWGPAVINDLILVFMVGTLYGLLVALFQVKGFPFSQPPNNQKGGKMFITFLIMAVPAGLGFLHYWAAQWETAIWIAAVTMTVIAWTCFNYYRKESWESMELAE